MVNDDDKYTPEEYFRLLVIDDMYHILVEGSDDQYVFELLIDGKFPGAIHQSVVVDSAEFFIRAGPENREIVENICTSVLTHPYSDRLVGFVDRQFRDFSLLPNLRDDINGHKVSGRVVWSRGHSIENYLFDFDILRNPLRVFSPPGFSQALQAFEEVFEAMMRMACAISLAAKDIGRLNRIRSSINSDIIMIDNSQVNVDFDRWRQDLLHRMQQEEIDELYGRLEFWHGKTQDADYNVIRWLCDGHIGFNFIWSVYSVCVRSFTRDGKLQKVKHPTPFKSCADYWVQKVIHDNYEYPSEIFWLFNMLPN